VSVLAAVSHGTSSRLGQAAVAGLVSAVARARPDIQVIEGFVDVQAPDVATTLRALPEGDPVVVVPLLLSAGYHVHVDLRRELERALLPTALADALGPHEYLVEVLVARLRGLRLRASDRIVLACAGSSDARAVEDCRQMARRLSTAVGTRVRAGFLSAATPSVAEAVRFERRAAPGARVVVSTYLLAPGFFADRALVAGAELVAPPLLLAHEPPSRLLVDLVLERFAAAEFARTPASAWGRAPA
jgi:sirohydrochlorin ferrochelatase